MAILALTNAKVLVGAADLSAWANEVNVEASVAALDATTFGSGGWVANVGGLRSAKLDIKGFFEASGAGYPDDELYGDLGTGGVVATVAPQGATDANIAYFGTFLEPQYKPGAKVGDLLAFDSAQMADAPLVRGQLANSTARTATGTGTALNLGAVGATQRVWSSLHVTSVTGTGSLTVTVQSDSASNFPSPATVATFTAATATTSQLVKGVIGVNADTYYRWSWVITGFTSVTFFGAIGIA